VPERKSRLDQKKLHHLTQRPEFLAVAASGTRFVAPGFILQKGKADAGNVRYGLTATKKLGNAVERNRARRRLRALAQKILLPLASSGDYVLVARAGALKLAFAQLERDLEKALKVLKCTKATSLPAS
jgi:ribonuclease P protein component